MLKISPQKQKELAVKEFLDQYETKFEVVDAAIDLRTMGKNYENNLIPLSDIAKGISAQLGSPNFNPNKIAYWDNQPKIMLDCPIDKLMIHPAFQRDVKPGGVEKICKSYKNDIPGVLKCIKHPLFDVFCLWDDHHTTQARIQIGFTKFHIQYTELEPIEGETEEQATKRMIQKAGEMFLEANWKNKNKLERYDRHMVSVETFQKDACAIQKIADACDVKIKRASKNAGEVSHVKHVYDVYELKDPFTHQQGTYMPRTLKFMRTCYPKQKVDPIIMLCVGKIFATTHLETMQTLPPEFDDDLMQLLRSLGSAEKIQKLIKESYENFFGGETSHPVMVYSGLVNLINKHSTKGWMLGAPNVYWPMEEFDV